MKFLKALLPALILALLLSGCSFRLFSTAEELIYPISPSGENANIQKALDNYIKNGYSLKTPVGGAFKTAYIFFDVDADGEEEAVTFYEPSSNPDTVNMAVIDKSESEWKVAYNIEGEGSDIYSIEFKDLDGDGILEFVVLWDVFSTSTSHYLTVYGRNDNENGFSLYSIGKPIIMNDYIAADVNGDKLEELLVFTVDSGDAISAKAVLYSYKNKTPESLGSTKLDGHISAYKSIKAEDVNGRAYIYADAAKSNGSQMLTEIVLWSDYYDTIISPFYNYSTGVTKETTRNVKLYSQYIGEKSHISIPLDADKKGLPAQTEAVDWQYYSDDVLYHNCYSIAIEKDNYQILIPDEFFDDVIISYDTKNSTLTVSDKNKKVLFTVTALLKSLYDENEEVYSDYTEIMNNSGYIYLAACSNDSDIKISTEDLKSMIKSYEGE
ncbi:MAG: VCBS repeat-containing protein [Eubacterium sp.]|nr:VCBS repeat-containing protein [Eubacterium sp.]